MSMGLSTKDYRECIDLIDLIYSVSSVSDSESMFRMVCRRLERLIGISTANLGRIDPEKRDLLTEAPFSFNIPEGFYFIFLKHYIRTHPLLVELRERKWSVPFNAVLCLNDMVTDARLQETEYHNDFQSKISIYYEIGCVLGTQGDPVGTVAFHRPKTDGPFTERERQILNILFPHLSRAFHIGDLLSGKASSPDCGVIEMEKGGRVSYMNEEAKLALKGMPAHVIPEPDLKGEASFFRNGRFKYRVRTIRTHWNAVEKTILLEPCFGRDDLCSKLAGYGLTKRQEEIAAFTVRGLAYKEIAELLSIREQTVRDHLRDIFGKAKVRSRGELTAKILGL
jgi:DNA-binding CsgD family transcriptional regulator